ncbi:hypothetical protein Taro_038404 [Colocasia esculenta]|uniref:Transposase Tnp1/En/Spm-like domain-containing protein n=1 Tax=Colocasia esculenta TaxID=4460 RepID=A0A843W3E0_COLES|nr:hypothetical protein [Colocasia esculenta]
MFLDEEDLQKLGLKMLEGIRWRSSSIHDALLQWHPDCQFFFFLCCFFAPQSEGAALIPFWKQILYPLSSSLLFFFMFFFQTAQLCSLSGRRLPFSLSAAATPFSGDVWSLFSWDAFRVQETWSNCVDTQANCVDTTSYCFRTGFWDSELVSTHRCTVSTPHTDCVDTQADCVDTTSYCFRTCFWDSHLVSTHRRRSTLDQDLLGVAYQMNIFLDSPIGMHGTSQPQPTSKSRLKNQTLHLKQIQSSRGATTHTRENLESVTQTSHVEEQDDHVENSPSHDLHNITEYVARESSPEENTSPKSMKDDLLSQVLGKDKPGRIRMLGLGPTPSSVYGLVPTHAQALQMVNQIKTSSETVISKMFEKIEEMKVEKEKMKESYENRLSTLHAEVDTLKDLMQKNNKNCQAHEDNASSSICSSASSREVQCHNVQRELKKRGRNDDILNAQGKAMVYLKSFKKSLVNVALATIESKDPLKKVGGCDLGYEYWEVAINVALVHNEPLPWPYAQFKTIGDAIGATIAWPFTLPCKLLLKAFMMIR